MNPGKAKPNQEAVMLFKGGEIHFTVEPKENRQHTFHAARGFTNYLHGAVPRDEVQAACWWEYARESQLLWENAELRDRLRAKDRRTPVDVSRLARNMVAKPGGWYRHFPFSLFLRCHSFPKKAWTELSQEERQEILRFCPPSGSGSLPVSDATTLKAMGVLDALDRMAREGAPVVKNVRRSKVGTPVKSVPAIVQKHGPHYYVVFEPDFSKGQEDIVKQFRASLRLPEFRELLKKHGRKRRGMTGEPLDRLKDLAAWRLYREKKNDWNAANEFANKNRKQSKFHGARKQEAELFGEDADARTAKARALQFLTTFMPEEFPPPPGRHLAAAFKKLKRLARRK